MPKTERAYTSQGERERTFKNGQPVPVGDAAYLRRKAFEGAALVSGLETERKEAREAAFTEGRDTLVQFGRRKSVKTLEIGANIETTDNYQTNPVTIKGTLYYLSGKIEADGSEDNPRFRSVKFHVLSPLEEKPNPETDLKHFSFEEGLSGTHKKFTPNQAMMNDTMTAIYAEDLIGEIRAALSIERSEKEA